MAKIFLQLDQQVDLNSRVLEQITGRNFDSEYVDIATFVGFFENEDEASLKSQILGHFPRIHLDWWYINATKRCYEYLIDRDIEM